MTFLFLGSDSTQLRDIMLKLDYEYTVWELFPQPVHKPSMAKIREIRPALLKALQRTKNVHIIGLGTIALKFILDRGSKGNIAHYRGRKLILAGTKRVCHVTYDPVDIIRNYDKKDLIIEDIKRLLAPKLKAPVNCWPTGKLIGFDTEYAPDESPLDVAIANGSAAYRIDPHDKKALNKLFKIHQLIGHGIGGDLTQLIKLGCRRNDWARGENIYDSFIVSRMGNENRGKGNYTVEALLLATNNFDGWKDITEAISRVDATQWPTEMRIERCRLDAFATYHIFKNWESLAQGPVDIQTRIATTIERARLAGAYVDLNAFETWSHRVKLEHKKYLDVLTKVAFRHGMREFSPTKPEDIRKLLFTKLKMKIDERTSTNLPAVNKAFLSRYKDEIPIIKQIYDFRKLDKLVTTYVAGIEKKFIHTKNGTYIPFRLMAMGTRTGRRAADKPNSQNWPKSARAIIKSRWKDGLILSNDFSKLEIILLAYEAGDEELMHYFTKEKNGYIAIGDKLFNKKVEEDTPEYRQIKAVILGVNYNLQSYGLGRQLWDLHNVRLSHTFESHVDKVDEVRRRYLRMFPRISSYQRERVRELHRNGYIQCWFGHRRRLTIPPEPPRSETIIWKQWRKIKAHLENEAINVVIQNAASYVTGTAMIDAEAALLDEYGVTHLQYHTALVNGKSCDLNFPLLINEVHDDLVFDCPKKEVRNAQHIINECMTKLRTLRTLMPEFDAPVRVGQLASHHWGVKV